MDELRAERDRRTEATVSGMPTEETDTSKCPECGGQRCLMRDDSKFPGITSWYESVPTTEQTWREAIKNAFAAVDCVYEYRREVLRAAHEAGLSLRQIAAVCGISAAGVHRIVGPSGKKRDDTLLDAPARLPRPARHGTEEK